MISPLQDYKTYTAQTPKSHPIAFSIGFTKGLAKGTMESGKQFVTFASDLIAHPIDTSSQVCEALTTIAKLAYSKEWNTLKEVIAPEVCRLIKDWHTLSVQEQGERAGYIFGKLEGNILLPGATTKAIATGLKEAKDILQIANNLNKAEKILALETLAQSSKSFTEPITKFSSSTKEFTHTREDVFKNPTLLASLQKFKQAEAFLKPYHGKYLPEHEVRNLIHQTGIPTFSRPKGIPENYRITVSEKGAGMLYVHPTNTGTYVRVMPGKLHSPNPHQQKPYVIQMKDGKPLDKFGNKLNTDDIQAHIPLEEFIYRSN